MKRMKFGAFLAPHHPVGEHPTLQFQRDLELVEHLDHYNYDEFWCGEHHSSGWEMIGSPEMFLAAAAMRTKRIKLGTGVVSLPYHHPFNVAQRMVQLDHMSHGRAIFGSGPGALPSDARTFGIDQVLLRDRQDEALGVIVRLLEGERFSYQCDWFQINEGQLQLLPLQEKMPMAAASSISPSGMQLAGKYGMGVLSIASTSQEGLSALPVQWSFAEEAAQKHGKTVDRRDWRVLISFHLAESAKDAEREALDGLWWWHNEYRVRVLGQLGAVAVPDRYELMAQVRGAGGGGAGASVVGTPDQLVAMVRNLQQVTGGFGTVLGFCHDWANREATLRSWELFARYVVPELNGYTVNQKVSAEFLAAHQAELMKGRAESIRATVKDNAKAQAALAVTMKNMAAAQQAGGFRPGSLPPMEEMKKVGSDD